MRTEATGVDHLVVPLAGARSLEACGGKAVGLAELIARGHDVPAGFVITVEGARALGRDPRVEASIRAMLGSGPVAVRSSAVGEDSAAASYAGLYETVLDVRGPDAVLDAVRRCIASADAPRVAAYGARGAIAVIVQEMIEPDAAGVAFTADPVTGERDVVIVSAVRGVGERLVSGLASAEEWRVRGDRAERVRDEGVLDERMASEIAALARRAGAERDVEWALRGGRIHLLQSRRITALPDAVSWEPPIPGGWVRNFRLGEWLGAPVTPLFESWLLSRIESRTHARLCEISGMPMSDRPAHVVVNGWYYYGLDYFPSAGRALLHLPRMLFKLATRFRQVAGLIPPMAHLGFDWGVRDFRERVLPAYRDAIDSSEGDVAARIDRIADAVAEVFVSIVGVAGFAAKAELPLAELLRRHVPEHRDAWLALVRGTDASAPPPHSVESLDWFFPTLGELGTAAPAPSDETRGRMRAERDALEREIRARLAAREQKRFDAMLEVARRAHAMREEQSRAVTLGWPALRGMVLGLGDELVARGVILASEDVFFLRREELGASASLAATVAARRRTWERQRRLPAPLLIGRLSGTFAKIFADIDQLLHGEVPAAPNELRGMPASPGRVSGVARVVRGAEEIERLREGEILVAPITTPAWTPAFLRAAAVVTDTGSIASHASVVAREYGLPAVVALGDATTRLRDGDRITVDGSRGVVFVE